MRERQSICQTPLGTVSALAMGLVIAATFTVSAVASENWHTGRLENLTIFACSRPACPFEATVAVSDPLATALPVGKAILDDVALAMRMAEAIAVGIGPSNILMPFRRADLGPHVGFLGVVKADGGMPMAAFISFKENRSRDFLATGSTVGDAMDGLIAVAEKVSQP